MGRQSVTPVDILYIEGIANPELAAEVERRVASIDIDALLMTGNLEQYITDEVNTAFPLTAYTERPDRFCAGLAEGRIGVLADGIPVGWLLPSTVDQFSEPVRTRPPTGWWPPPWRCCGTCACSSRCFYLDSMWGRCCSTLK